MLSPDDTIAAIASAAGSGGRAILRLSGTDAITIALRVFQPTSSVDLLKRHVYSGVIVISDLQIQLPAQLFVFPSARSYTGQTVVEVHCISSQPVVEQLLTSLLSAGARSAQPGEFTLRAFLAGKLDLPRAEAVLGVIEAGNRNELKKSLKQLAGGLSRPLDGLREDLLDLLADLEAGLDFADEDIQFVDNPRLLSRLARGMAQVTMVQKQVQDRSLVERSFRVVLVGPANVGKSSLFNALTGKTAIVSEIPGTTRDYLVARFDIDEQSIELIDTAGLRLTDDNIEIEAQQLGHGIINQADLLLVCMDSATDFWLPSGSKVSFERIGTKCDFGHIQIGQISTSAKTGQGLEDLRKLIANKARARSDRGLAPSLSRCRHHVESALEHLRKAHQCVLFDDPPEIVALELRTALDSVGALTGAVHTDDLLDRVFSRFCIGK